jgi:hypothetical protein
MKVIRILGHPIVLTVVFLLLLIEGDHFGGFYLIYILLALPHGAIYALLAVGGVILLLISHYFLNAFKHGLSIVAVLLMLTSLVVFFGKGNKNETFELVIPILTFVLFGVCLLCYFIDLFSSGLDNDKSENNEYRMI